MLATLLFTEQPGLTMGELADRLHASSGAISAMHAAAESAIATTARNSLARRRLIQMRDFDAFVVAEIRALCVGHTWISTRSAWSSGATLCNHMSNAPFDASTSPTAEPETAGRQWLKH